MKLTYQDLNLKRKLRVFGNIWGLKDKEFEDLKISGRFYEFETNDPQIALEDIRQRCVSFANSPDLTEEERELAHAMAKQYNFFEDVQSLKKFEQLLNKKYPVYVPVEFINDHIIAIIFTGDERAQIIDRSIIAEKYGKSGINIIEGEKSVKKTQRFFENMLYI